MKFFKSRKGTQSDSFLLLNIFIFLGVFIFLGSLYYSSLPDETINMSGLEKPPEINTTTPIVSYMGLTEFIDYTQNTIGNIGSSHYALYLILLVPLTITISFILIKLAKPFS
jgi:hypothetical protein